MRGGYSRAESCRASGSGPSRLQGLGGLRCSPRQLRAGPASGGSDQSQAFQSSMTHEPGKFCQARLCSLIHDTLWKALQGSCVRREKAGQAGGSTHLAETSPLQLSLPPLLESTPESPPESTPICRDLPAHTLLH